MWLAVHVDSFKIGICFIGISRLKFAKRREYLKNELEAEILKSTQVVNTVQFYILNQTLNSKRQNEPKSNKNSTSRLLDANNIYARIVNDIPIHSKTKISYAIV